MTGPGAHAVRLLRTYGIAALFLAVASFGVASGLLFAFIGDLPQISALDDYSPRTTTRVLGRDGSVVGEFATERRQLVTYDQIPPVLRNAILSVEDARFFSHAGFRIERIVVAAVRDVLHRRMASGASTITQQLSRNLFPATIGFERGGLAGLERKVKELLVAIQIEKRYTKQEIFTMYCNKTYWGHLTYGVEAASELYFGKHVGEITLDEAALLAGIIQGNERQSPYVNMAAAVSRRNLALDRMAAEGYITTGEAAAAKKRPVVTAGQPSRLRTIAPYFLERLRIPLEEKYGAKALYEDGLTIRTGLDASLQRVANHALDAGLRVLDKRRGFRKPAHVPDAKFDTYRNPRWTRDPVEGDVVTGLVTASAGSVIRVRAGRWSGSIDRAGYAWTGRASAEAVARRGDLIDVLVKTVDVHAAVFTGQLEQEPLLQGAVLAMDNHTGQVMAMIGGTNFQRSQFNRAVQAMRQVGSLFKPIVFTAAIDRGYTATSILVDEPTSYPAGPNQPPYAPQNYEHDYDHETTVRHALEHSRNVPTVWLMNQLGPASVIPYARQLGITAPIQPYLSTAIGASDATLIEMTAAYTAFPGEGVRMSPLLLTDVTDRDGNLLEQHLPQPHEAIRADTASIMTGLLQGVIAQGTGATEATKKLRDLHWPLGGKTGTTDDYTDAWFIGFDPDITIGVWVGFDVKKPIGANATGAVAALPIWAEIMDAWVDRRSKELAEPPQFPRPSNVVFVDGEAYVAGTEPGARR